jgi:hypothetical protein
VLDREAANCCEVAFTLKIKVNKRDGLVSSTMRLRLMPVLSHTRTEHIGSSASGNPPFERWSLQTITRELLASKRRAFSHDGGILACYQIGNWKTLAPAPSHSAFPLPRYSTVPLSAAPPDGPTTIPH